MPQSLHLIARPQGEPKDSDFEVRPVATRELNDGEARVAVRFVSVDPAMRIWMCSTSAISGTITETPATVKMVTRVARGPSNT